MKSKRKKERSLVNFWFSQSKILLTNYCENVKNDELYEIKKIFECQNTEKFFFVSGLINPLAQ